MNTRKWTDSENVAHVSFVWSLHAHSDYVANYLWLWFFRLDSMHFVSLHFLFVNTLVLLLYLSSWLIKRFRNVVVLMMARPFCYFSPSGKLVLLRPTTSKLMMRHAVSLVPGIMVTSKKRQEFQMLLQKRARRRAEKKVEYLEDDRIWKEVTQISLVTSCLRGHR